MAMTKETCIDLRKSHAMRVAIKKEKFIINIKFCGKTITQMMKNIPFER